MQRHLYSNSAMVEIYTADTPAAVKNATGLHLITESTPNGKKVQILLEEFKAAYGTEWTTSLIDLETDEQKESWFLHLNPNGMINSSFSCWLLNCYLQGKIPILIDNTLTPPFPVMESSAELLYLIDMFDKDCIFGFDSKHEHSEAVQWLLFWQASGQPNQGQHSHFCKSAPETVPYAISRFRTETLRIYDVLEARLSGRWTGVPREYLAGTGKGKYSIADIGTWPWVRSWRSAQFANEDMAGFPCLLQWIARIAERPAVQRGISSFYDSEENPELRVLTNR
ncbi:glutathione S-transferase protein [Rutstroemia sp. NJR-2017a BVV2]|nr:glutathione S-transferase protein [Rutstroemia sp. NJR-2017a BVV2]